MTNYEVEIRTVVTISVDESDFRVKDYDSIEELIDDLVSYRFSPILPVVQDGGVKVNDYEILEHSYQKQETEVQDGK